MISDRIKQLPKEKESKYGKLLEGIVLLGWLGFYILVGYSVITVI